MKQINLYKIKQLRKENKLSQGDMAELLGMNTLYPYQRKESGVQPFTAEELYEIASYFNKNTEYFFDISIAKNAINDVDKATS